MPKPANRLDFQTIADVLFTVEYTALHSDTYALQVMDGLDRSFSADRTFSIRQQFPDQWFDLHNPDQTGMPMAVRLETRQEDFPPNLNELEIGDLLLCFIRGEDETFEMNADLRFTENGREDSVGGSAQSIDGIISTRRPGNALEWQSMIGTRPTGSWELRLPDTEEVRSLFRDEWIKDILLIINYEGTPPWPE